MEAESTNNDHDTSQEQECKEATFSTATVNDKFDGNGVLHDELEKEVIYDKQRTVVLGQLRHPGSWMTNAQIAKCLSRSVFYQASFSRNEFSNEKQIKMGTVELQFGSVEAARIAFIELKNLAVDGVNVEVTVDPLFFDPASSTSKSNYFALSEEADVQLRTIYAIRLPSSVDRQLLESIVGTDVIQDFRILPLPNVSGLAQVEIVTCSEEAATTARTEGDDFELDNGEQQTVVKLLTPLEYSEWVASETEAKPFIVEERLANGVKDVLDSGKDTSTSIQVAKNGEAKSSNQNQMLAPEISEDDVLNRLLQYIDVNRVNWAEINEKEEVYAMCDAISAEFNGLPDSLLKPVMLSALQRHLSASEVHWMRQHLETLIRMWKLETAAETFFERGTVVRMETVDYKPVAEAAKNKKPKSSRAGRVMMGVGAFLEQARNKIETENGEFDFEEDDDGNIVIGNEALSFESWAKISKTKQSDVVRAKGEFLREEGMSKKQKRLARIVQDMSQDDYKAWKREQISKRKGDIKVRIMQKARKEAEELGSESAAKSDAVEEKKKKELDEGEIDSDEDDEGPDAATSESAAKRKRKSSGSSSSSSSDSSSDSDEDANDSRRRRRKRRKQEKKHAPRQSTSSTITPMIKMLYDHRKTVVAALSPGHKVALAKVLTEIRQNSTMLSQSQATQMMSAMSQILTKSK